MPKLTKKRRLKKDNEALKKWIAELQLKVKRLNKAIEKMKKEERLKEEMRRRMFI
jgi:hypothetical protein